jgi:YfiH family protein
MKRHSKNNLVWYESESLSNLGVKHGFFTRYGGISSAPFDSLNIKMLEGENPENISQNRTKVLGQFGLKDEDLVFSMLVHGDELAWVDRLSSDVNNFDALATAEPGMALGFGVADCLPIIISDGKIVSIIHAGWRGTASRIVQKTIATLIKKHGFDINKAVAALGPCICQEHFSIGLPASEILASLAGDALDQNSDYHVNLITLNKKQLQEYGITNIDVLNKCSFDDEWFSYRRDNAKTGRNLAIALLK